MRSELHISSLRRTNWPTCALFFLQRIRTLAQFDDSLVGEALKHPIRCDPVVFIVVTLYVGRLPFSLLDPVAFVDLKRFPLGRLHALQQIEIERIEFAIRFRQARIVGKWILGQRCDGCFADRDSWRIGAAHEIQGDNPLRGRLVALPNLRGERKPNCRAVRETSFQAELGQFRDRVFDVVVVRSRAAFLYRSNDRMLEDLSDLRLSAILRANVDKNKSAGSPFPIVARDGKTAAALERAPCDMQAAMTSRANVTDRAA